MSKWFESANFASYAKSALLNAQKKIDQVLDIKDDLAGEESSGAAGPSQNAPPKATSQEPLTSSSHTLDDLKTDRSDARSDISSSKSNISVRIENMEKDDDSEFRKGWIQNFVASTVDASNKQSLQTKQEAEKKKENLVPPVDKPADIDFEEFLNTPRLEQYPEAMKNSRDSCETTITQYANQDLEQTSRKDDASETQEQPSLSMTEDQTKDSAQKETSDDSNENQHSEPKSYPLSGNTSSNEEPEETCASSDIEVLSIPSNQGDQCFNQPGKSHKRKQSNDSKKNRDQALANNSEGSSGMNDASKSSLKNSNKQISYVKSPPAPAVNMFNIGSHFQSQASGQTSADSELSGEKKIALEYEERIIKLNQQTAKLLQENENLVIEIKKLKTKLAERHDASQEHELFKKSFELIQNECVELKRVQKEKDEIIEQLEKEGLKLSKQELNQSNIIKKLRAKEKDNEEMINQQKNEIQSLKKELDELKNAVKNNEETEEKMSDSVRKLEKQTLTLEKELATKKRALDEANEKIKQMDVMLMDNLKQVEELQKSLQATSSKSTENSMTLEAQYKEELQQALEKERLSSNKKQEALRWELQNTRTDIMRLEQQYSLREDILRKEISDLQQQLRDAENRNNEISQNISSATRPLIKQIENLQISFKAQSDAYENTERSLSDRLKESQKSYADLNQKYNDLLERSSDQNEKLELSLSEATSLANENSKLKTELSSVNAKCSQQIVDMKEKELQLNGIIQSLRAQIESLIQEKKEIEQLVKIEKLKNENDRKHYQTLIETLTREEDIRKNTKPVLEKTASFVAEKTTVNIPEKAQDSFNLHLQTSGLLRTNDAMVCEMLQSKLKEKDGEIIQLKREIEKLEKVKDILMKEAEENTERIQNLENNVLELPRIKEKLASLEFEYNALLQMYGEKSEENEELKLDLQDVKTMYKAQIEDLLSGQRSS